MVPWRMVSIECLHLRFLFNTEQSHFIGRVDVEPDDVSDVLDKERIVGELVAVRLSRGSTIFLPAGAAGTTPDPRPHRPADEALDRLNPIFRRLYQEGGRPSIEPEQLSLVSGEN